MKKQDLLKMIDGELIDKLFGFCYARTSDSYEAQELCSDILFELVKAANAQGDIEQFYPFLWKVARHVYADFSNSRRQRADRFYEGDAQELLSRMAAGESKDDSGGLLEAVYRRIAFLTRAYREVMVMFYLDGLSVSDIAARQHTSEGAVRQRLFSARKKIRNEVEDMTDRPNKPVALDDIRYVLWGTGNPGWGDPRTGFTRQFSKHIVWLCHKKPARAADIAQALNVPVVYVEEELELLERGENGQYGLLRRLDSGQYALNFILMDKEEMAKANAVYTERLPVICRVLGEYIEQHKAEYLAFPYRNKKIDWNLILWQQMFTLATALQKRVEQILSEEYFAGIKADSRPFQVFGYVDNGQYYGGGCDGVSAHHVCGYAAVHLENIYITRIKPHFHCCLNVAQDTPIQLAIRAVEGLDVHTLSEAEKEHAAKAVECGYVYREGGTLYTKILVSDMKDMDRQFDISRRLLDQEDLEKEAREAAGQIAGQIRRTVPDYLLGEWRLANVLAGMPVLDAVVEDFIEKGLLIPPEDGIGAEGCWMSLEK